MKRIFEVRADQGLSLAGPGVVYMVIQWGCLAKCQGTRKGGLEFLAGFQLAVAATLARLFAQKFHVRSSVRFADAEKRTLVAITPEPPQMFRKNFGFISRARC